MSHLGTHEILPASIFTGDIPQTLVEGSVFWLRLDPDVLNSFTEFGWVELRPKSLMWRSSVNNWTIFSHTFEPWTKASLRMGDRRIVDSRSSTFSMVYERLRSFEKREYVLVSENPDYFPFKTQLTNTMALHVELPRFRLMFFLDDDGQLQSHNITQCIIDVDQSVGTLTGLVNRLVLAEPRGQIEFPRRRRVLVPIGDIQCRRTGTHVEVSIAISFSQKLLYYDYIIDTELGCLVGNSTLESRLYKIYLHALTGNFLPDVLTQQMGLKVALDELRSAGTLSFQTLTPFATELLRKLRQLTPSRSYYPPTRKSMHNVEWISHLPSIAQHTGFEIRVLEIFTYASDLALFDSVEDGPMTVKSSGIQDDDLLPSSPKTLISRARDWIQLPQKFSSSNVSRRDVQYVPVYARSSGKGEHQSVAHAISRQDLSTISRFASPSALEQTISSWKFMHVPLSPPFSLSYSREWLSPSSILMTENWLLLCRLIHRTRSGDGYASPADQPLSGLLFCSTSLAYESPSAAEMGMLVHLLAIGVAPYLPHCILSSDYDLRYGTSSDRHRLKDIISRHLLVKDSGETDILVDSVLQRRSLYIPPHSRAAIKSEPELARDIKEIFEHWQRNNELMKLIAQTESQLRVSRADFSGSAFFFCFYSCIGLT